MFGCETFYALLKCSLSQLSVPQVNEPARSEIHEVSGSDIYSDILFFSVDNMSYEEYDIQGNGSYGMEVVLFKS